MLEQEIDFINRFHRRFRCLRCGKCCTMGIGIALLPKETRRLKEIVPSRLGISLSQFKELTYTKDGGRYIKYPCPFYKDGCIIYTDRPLACRMYPLSILKNKGVFISNRCASIRKTYGDLCEQETKSKLTGQEKKI
jgi:Fe-S-cluster containining protein